MSHQNSSSRKPPHHLINFNNPRTKNRLTSNLSRILEVHSSTFHDRRDSQPPRKPMLRLERERSAEVRHTALRLHIKDWDCDRKVLARQVDEGVSFSCDAAAAAHTEC